MKTFLTKIFLLTFAVSMVLVGSISPAEAIVVKGLAPITNEDIEGARKEARRQAMREAVEAVAGVHVQSRTDVANMMVVKDEISLKSDGYIVVNKVISEGRKGNIYCIELDVDISTEKIRQFAQDLKSQVDANLTDSNSRSGIMVAVVKKDFGSSSYSYDSQIGDYLNAKLRFVGFNAVTNDNVVNYLVSHANDPDVRIKARAIAKDPLNREETNALLRGVLEIDSVKKVGGFYEAVVNTSFELIGLDSSYVDVFTKYVKGAGATEREAIENAKESATREAMESLARQSLETVQNETRGGYTNLKVAVVIDNVTNYQAQYPLIKAGLERANCKIIRTTRPHATRIALFVSSDSYSSVGELSTALEEAIGNGIAIGITPAGEIGSTKIYLSF